VPENQRETLLQVRDLEIQYKLPRQVSITALEGLSFKIRTGESVGVLGESGSGKSTLALSILRLLPPNATVVRGTIHFQGLNMLVAPERMLEEIRGSRIAMVFQQPGMALTPFMRVCRQVAEVIRAHHKWSLSRCRYEARLVLERVFGAECDQLIQAYPHQLSSGQRQRISIAQALACSPQLIIADEPTASLDGVVQAGILNLLRDLRFTSSVSLMLITHNPAILPGLVDRVLVLRGGQLVEEGVLQDLCRRPQVPYTAELLRSTLVPSAE
jgi:ABC-type dipeptide/oligopeptide/nickel transport system ATPase component